MAPEWTIQVADGSHDPVKLALGRTVIGRGHLLQIRELKVSRHHAEIQVTETGEFILKAMHPGLPCYYQTKDNPEQKDLTRGECITLHVGDRFALHHNPECHFKLLSSNSEDNADTEPESPPTDNGAVDGGDKDASKPDIKETKAASKPELPSRSPPTKTSNRVKPPPDDEEDDEEEEDVNSRPDKSASEEESPAQEASEGSDWDEDIKPKKRTPAKKPTPKRNKPKAPVRKAPPSKKKKLVSSEEEEEKSESQADDDAGSGSESEDKPTRRKTQPPSKPSRRASTQAVNYQDNFSDSQEEPSEVEDSDPYRPGRRKKQSDSEFEISGEGSSASIADSDSDWGSSSKRKSSKRKSAPKPTRKSTRPRKAGKRVVDSDDSDEDWSDGENYRPRPSKRRAAAV